MTPSRKYEPPSNCRPIVLVGMMGAGKSTIGRLVAKRLNLPFADADDEIEKAAGMTIPELFEKHGEESFRVGEAKVIERLLNEGRQVIATGGGAVIDAQTRAHIKEKAFSIWLKADLDTLFERVSRKSTRPLLQRDNPRAVLKKLLKERELFYAEADVHIDSRNQDHSACVQRVIDAIDRRETAVTEPDR